MPEHAIRRRSPRAAGWRLRQPRMRRACLDNVSDRVPFWPGRPSVNRGGNPPAEAAASEAPPRWQFVHHVRSRAWRSGAQFGILELRIEHPHPTRDLDPPGPPNLPAGRASFRDAPAPRRLQSANRGMAGCRRCNSPWTVIDSRFPAPSTRTQPLAGRFLAQLRGYWRWLSPGHGPVRPRASHEQDPSSGHRA